MDPTIRNVPFVRFTTEGRNAREIETGGRPSRLRFTLPTEQMVRFDDLPANVPVGKGRLVVKRFTNSGFAFEEINTSGEWVAAEIYYGAHADPQRLRRELTTQQRDS